MGTLSEDSDNLLALFDTMKIAANATSHSILIAIVTSIGVILDDNEADPLAIDQTSANKLGTRIQGAEIYAAETEDQDAIDAVAAFHVALSEFAAYQLDASIDWYEAAGDPTHSGVKHKPGT